LVTALAGCAIRYDDTGVSRTGIFLWGLGDPPGVHWDLGQPRREIQELPPARRRELPPSGPSQSLAEFAPRGANQSPPDRAPLAIDDNRDRVESRAPVSTVVPLSLRPDGRDDGVARH
jgi:hypothetical protein